VIERSQERIDQTGEIFTPAELVEIILDQFPPEIWADAKKTWLDPTCGDGNFLVAVQKRLMNGLQDVISDSTTRHQHILENQLFGVDLMSDNVELCVDRLNAAGLFHNIVCADGLEYDYGFGRSELDESGMFEQPSQTLYKHAGKNAWYTTESG